MGLAEISRRKFLVTASAVAGVSALRPQTPEPITRTLPEIDATWRARSVSDYTKETANVKRRREG
jgi:hypothetical protein